jgi:hypothetical protein
MRLSWQEMMFRASNERMDAAQVTVKQTERRQEVSWCGHSKALEIPLDTTALLDLRMQ